MTTPPAKIPRKKPLMLTPRDEKILRAIYEYRYMTALDVAWLLFKPTSRTHVTEILSSLAGGDDLQTHSYLCRFGLPSVGNSERVYTLGAKGRSFLAEHGLPITWYFRPYKLKHFSYSHVQHNLILTRFVVALNVWIRKQTDFTLSTIRFGHELTGTPGRVTVEGKTVPVIPDAWILLGRTRTRSQIPIFLEIDRGMEFQKRFKEHIRARIQFYYSGEYERMFGSESVRIYYATSGQAPEYRERRRATMRLWTSQVLEELHLQDWADVFRFASLEFDKLYDLTLFEKPVWYRPDSPTPVALLPA
jgi:hypothetical protein